MKWKLRIPEWAKFKNLKMTWWIGKQKWSYHVEDVKRTVDSTDKKYKKRNVFYSYITAKLEITILILVCAIISVLVFWGFYRLISIIPFKYIFSTIGNFLEKVTPDAWIEFIGGIIGSVVTVVGLILTFKFERRKDEKAKKEQAQPIIILHRAAQNSISKSPEMPSSLILDFRVLNPNSFTAQTIELFPSDLIIRNIGFNAAINIDLSFNFNEYLHVFFCSLDCLSPNEANTISIEIRLFKKEIDKYFKRKLDDNTINKNLYFMVKSSFNNADKDTANKSNTIYIKNGELTISYQDVYGNKYNQYYQVALCIDKRFDGTYTAHMIYPTYSREVVLLKNKRKQ